MNNRQVLLARQAGFGYVSVKRALDIILSIAALCVFLPLFPLIALLIRLDSKGPVLYRHRRAGQHGKPFYALKFRSMVQGADALLAGFSAEQRAEWQANCKLRNDPRVTRVGRFLRVWSLDELPQLFNVLRGEMSLVGPRPVTEEELARYGALQREFLCAKPGITGHWQTLGRSDTSYEERVRLEMHYVENASLWLDAAILLRTAGAVLSRRGAV